MGNTGQAGLLLMLLLFCGGVARAQQVSVAASSDKDLATVYVYRLDEGTVVLGFLSKTLPVYLGERDKAVGQQKKIKLAGLKNKSYFMLRLPAGRYVFDTRLMWGHLNLEVAAGGEYYLRLDRGNDCPSEDPDYNYLPPTCVDRNPFVESVSHAQWSEELTRLKPVTAGDVKERKLVIIPPKAK